MTGPTIASAPQPENTYTARGIDISPKRPSAAVLLALFALAAVVYWLVTHRHWGGMWLEDMPIYTGAVRDFLAGRNPYNDSLAPLYFLYPPFFLGVAGLLSHLFPASSGEYAYMGLHIAATCALPLVLARFYFRQTWLGPLFALLLFLASPRFTGMLALATFNVASILYCLAFIAGIPGLRRNNWSWFYLAVVFAAMIKITFLALLLLPLLAGSRQLWRIICCAATVVTFNLAEHILWPQLYGQYQAAIRQGIFANKAYGYGVFGLLANFHSRNRMTIGPMPYIAFAVVAVLVLAALLLVYRRRFRSPAAGTTAQAAQDGVWLAVILMAIVLVNPRVLQYDVDIAVFAAFVVLVYVLRARRLLLLMGMLFLPSLFVPLVVLNPHVQGVYEMFLVLAAFACGSWALWKRPVSSGAVAQQALNF